MKKILLIISVLAIAFTSCDVKDEIEKTLEKNAKIEETVTENVNIPKIIETGKVALDPIKVDTSEISKKIKEEEAKSKVVSIKEVSIENLKIEMPASSNLTFDFLNSLTLTIGGQKVVFDNIPAGAKTLNLPEGQSIKGLKTALESNNLSMGIELDVKKTTTEPVTLQIISEFLIQLDVEL